MSYFYGKGTTPDLTTMSSRTPTTPAGQPEPTRTASVRDPDPPGNTRGQCTERCNTRYRDMIAQGGRAAANAEQFLQRCLQQCEDQIRTPPNVTPGTSPCKGGYKGQQVQDAQGNWRLLTPCREGHTAQRDGAGNIWCCPDAVPPPGKECTKNTDCPEGQKCVEGKCVDKKHPGGACEGGYKLSTKPLTPEGGDPWTDEYITKEMGFFRNSAHQGHYIHKGGKFYNINDVHAAIQAGREPTPLSDAAACQKGFAVKTINGESWCCPEGGSDGTDGVDPDFGVFKFPSELEGLYGSLMGRAGDFLNRKPGYSDSVMRGMFGADADVLRNQGLASGNQLYDYLAREGMTGTGAGQGMMANQAWQTERGIGDLMRDLFISGEGQKKQDLLDYTGGAQSLFGTGVQYKQLEEVLNAARRGEQQNALAMFLSYLMQNMGSWGK